MYWILDQSDSLQIEHWTFWTFDIENKGLEHFILNILYIGPIGPLHISLWTLNIKDIGHYTYWTLDIFDIEYSANYEKFTY